MELPSIFFPCQGNICSPVATSLLLGNTQNFYMLTPGHSVSLEVVLGSSMSGPQEMRADPKATVKTRILQHYMLFLIMAVTVYS